MPAPQVWITTLGCAKNQVDSDKLSARLAAGGYRTAARPDDADVVLVNTCAFIEAARRESVETILEHASQKSADTGLVVLGCMAQRYQRELSEAIPEADDVVGLEHYGELLDRLDALTGHDSSGTASVMDILEDVRRPTPETPYAYVKVAEGCDKPCTFCAIPLIRGAQRSRAIDNIVEEITDLGAAGVGEIVLVAQDLAAYGRDLPGSDGLVDLLRGSGSVSGIRRIRLLYLHPREITAGLIAEMTENEKVAGYFDLSLQHASGRLLRAMKRPGDGDRHLGLIGSIRGADAAAALRSSFIVGFPGETESDVEVMADFLGAAALDWAGFFPYSAEEGTAAAMLGDRIPDGEIAERTRFLSGIQAEITAERNAAQVGRITEVVVDLVEDGVPVARSGREAPEIDGMIVLDRGEAGDWLNVRITGSYGTDCVAEVVE
jgi:ribosomal protein S12 methylthiotransferase